MGCRRLRTLRCGAIVSLRPRATAAARRITMTMPRPKPGDLLGLVDVDKGIVSREIFVNEEIYRQELHLDLLLDAWDGREGGTEVIGGIHKASTCAWRRSLWNSSRWRRLRQSARQRSPEMPYSDEADERSAGRRSEVLEKLLVPVAIVGHVLFYDVLPALLTWVVGSTAGLDLFSAIDNPSLRRLAGLGLFLGVVAAIITTESVTRLAPPVSIGHFLTTVVLIGAALFPTLADWHRLRLGLTPEQFALVQAYCYLALKVMVGILIGATLSWILQARYARLVSSRRPEYTRK